MVNKANSKYHSRKLKDFVSKKKNDPIIAAPNNFLFSVGRPSSQWEAELLEIWRKKLLDKTSEVLMQ
jgi:hypothetical protein